MKQKIFHIIVVIVFLFLFSYFFHDEYWEYQSQQKEGEALSQEISQEGEDFSPEKIIEVSSNIELLHTPSLELLDSIVAQIDAAKKNIYVEVYIFTEKRMRDALIKAHKRGVDVKILLENNPYMAPYLNDAHYNAFASAGIDVRWSDPLNYSLNHAKLLMIDDIAYISTGNFSYSLFKYNRDFLLQISRGDIFSALEKIFFADFEHTHNIPYHSNLVISPEYSRFKLEKLIETASESIDFYFPYIQDSHFEEKLFLAAQRGVKIRGIVEEKFYLEQSDVIQKFQEKNISVTPLSSEKLHSKAMLFDEEILYIGSINFSRYSFDENREIGILLRDEKNIGRFQNIFLQDSMSAK